MSLIINIYGWDGNKNYGYEVVCGENISLRFNYMKKIHTERILTDFECDILKKKINNINLILFPKHSECTHNQCPSIKTVVEIKNQFNKAKISWNSDDELNHEKSFAGILKLIKTVEDMLTVDFTGLDLPAYY